MIKTYLKSYGYLFGILFILTFILSIINYFFIIPINIFKILILVISFLVSTIILGKNIKQKAYLEGLKFSSIYLIIVVIINFLILKSSFSIKNLVFYLLILFTGIIGTMIGINLKKK